MYSMLVLLVTGEIMEKINKHLYCILFAGWLGVILFFLAGIPEYGYQMLDINTSISLTNFLKSHPEISNVLLKFNSVDEMYLNVPIILTAIAFAVSGLKAGRKQAFIGMLAALFWVEFWIMGFINPFFSKIAILDFNVVPEVGAWMLETKRVVASNGSILSRHVFAMFFLSGYCYNSKYSKPLKVLIWFLALVFAVPPLLNAKHWLSDWIFSLWFTFSAIHFSKFINLESRLQNFFQNK